MDKRSAAQMPENHSCELTSDKLFDKSETKFKKLHQTTIRAAKHFRFFMFFVFSQNFAKNCRMKITRYLYLLYIYLSVVLFLPVKNSINRPYRITHVFL